MLLNQLETASGPSLGPMRVRPAAAAARQVFPKVEAVYYSLRPTYRWAVRRAENPMDCRIEIRTVRSLPDLLDAVLRCLIEEDPSLPSRLCAVDDCQWLACKHRTRRYFAEARDLLYLDNPRLAERFARQIGSVWMATNIGRPETSAMLREIRGAARVPVALLSTLKV